jgi:hypothetical protein
MAAPKSLKATTGGNVISPTKQQLGATWLYLVVVIVTILGLSRCTDTDQSRVITVTREQYGERWPFPQFERATIGCASRSKTSGVSIKLGETTYGLNGHAQSMYGLPDASLHIRRRPGTGSYSIDGRGLLANTAAEDFIDMGLKLCS